MQSADELVSDDSIARKESQVTDEDEEEEVLLEPRFTYSRILNSIPSVKLLNKQLTTHC